MKDHQSRLYVLGFTQEERLNKIIEIAAQLREQGKSSDVSWRTKLSHSIALMYPSVGKEYIHQVIGNSGAAMLKKVRDAYLGEEISELVRTGTLGATRERAQKGGTWERKRAARRLEVLPKIWETLKEMRESGEAVTFQNLYPRLATSLECSRDVVKGIFANVLSCADLEKLGIERTVRIGTAEQDEKHRQEIDALYHAALEELPEEERTLKKLACVMEKPVYYVISYAYSHPAFAQRLIDGASVFGRS